MAVLSRSVVSAEGLWLSRNGEQKFLKKAEIISPSFSVNIWLETKKADSAEVYFQKIKKYKLKNFKNLLLS